MKIRAEEARYWAREMRLRAKAAAHAFGLVHLKNVRDPDYYLRLGNLLKRHGRFDEAADAFRRSFELNPSRAAYVELIGSVAAGGLSAHQRDATYASRRYCLFRNRPAVDLGQTANDA